MLVLLLRLNIRVEMLLITTKHKNDISRSVALEMNSLITGLRKNIIYSMNKTVFVDCGLATGK